MGKRRLHRKLVISVLRPQDCHIDLRRMDPIA
jgi:hypothetical protein